MVALSSPTILPCRQDALYSAPAMMHRLWYFSIRHCGMVCLENMGPTYDIPCSYRHREPSGMAWAMREAIPHSWNENKVHSITHEKGAAS